MYEFIGLLKSKVGDREGDGQTGHWRVAQFLLETVEMYPKRMVVDVKDGAFRRIEEFESLIGKNVRVEFDVDSREYPQGSGKWYNSVKAFRVYDRAYEMAREAEQSAAAETKPASAQQPAQNPEDPFAQLQNGGNDLPY